jgi:hypothetical protein
VANENSLPIRAAWPQAVPVLLNSSRKASLVIRCWWPTKGKSRRPAPENGYTVTFQALNRPFRDFFHELTFVPLNGIPIGLGRLPNTLARQMVGPGHDPRQLVKILFGLAPNQDAVPLGRSLSYR